MFQFLGGKQLVFEIQAFLNIGEELDLPESHFMPGSLCRIEKVLGQSAGRTRYLATIMRGRFRRREEPTSLEDSAILRGRVSAEVGVSGGGTFLSEDPQSDIHSMEPLIKTEEEAVLSHVMQGREDGAVYLRQRGEDESQGVSVSGGRRSRINLPQAEAVLDPKELRMESSSKIPVRSYGIMIEADDGDGDV